MMGKDTKVGRKIRTGNNSDYVLLCLLINISFVFGVASLYPKEIKIIRNGGKG